MNKKSFVTQLIRHLVQLVAFILFPGLFIMVFSSIRDIFIALVDGSFSVSALLLQIIIVFTVFLITILWGRFFCGFLCSFGMLQEVIFFFSKKFISGKVNFPPRLDYVMKFTKYFIIIFIILGVWVLALPVDSSLNPWGVFGMLVSGNFSVISSAIPTVGFALLISIFIGSFFVNRFFCRYLCPLGALFTITSKKRFYKIRRQGSSCINCGICERECSMGINIIQKDAVYSGECIDCMKCTAVCPKESLSANPAGAIAGTAAAAAVGGMVIVGNLVSVPVNENISEKQITEKKQEGKYTDGVYKGVGKGFRGNTEVEVTVENGYITEIKVISFEDDKEFFNKAQSSVISEIISNQSSDVDAVSGATFSSNSIVDAVANALGESFNEQGQEDDEKNGDDVEGQEGDGNGNYVKHPDEKTGLMMREEKVMETEMT